MIAVVIVAGILALPSGWREFAALLTIEVVTVLAARRLLSRGKGRLAGICFWVLAILANVLYAAACVVPVGFLPEFLCLGWLLILLPTLAGFGSTWATLASRDLAVDRPRRSRPWLWVIFLTAMPLATAVTLWPFRLMFLAAMPALDRLANRVAAGQAVGSPVSAGPFRIVASAVDPASGNVGLVIDPNPNGPTGFIREGRAISPGPYGCFRPFRGDALHVGLGGGWCYHEED
jgi:hypothetical protein